MQRFHIQRFEAEAQAMRPKRLPCLEQLIDLPVNQQKTAETRRKAPQKDFCENFVVQVDQFHFGLAVIFLSIHDHHALTLLCFQR